MIDMDFDYLEYNPDRHGNVRLYVRRNGKRVRLREKEGTPAFAKEYVAAVEKLAPGAPAHVTAPVTHPKDTFGWLVALYFQGRGAGEFLTLDADSRTRRRNSLEACLQIPLSDTNPSPMGNCPLKHLSAQKMKRIIETKDGPGARTNLRKHLSALCSWSVENNYLPSNPVRDIKAGRRVKGGGYYTWTIPDVQQFLAYHREQPARQSRKAVLALGLLLFAGTRRQDMIALGKQHCRGTKPGVLGDWIQYVPKKTIKVRRQASQKPLLPVLKDIINECADVLGNMTFLVTEQGKPFSENGIGNWFRDRCDEAGLPMCTAHGLKKAGATIAAENGATTRQLMAMFDWDTPDMAEVYTRAAEQKRLAGEGMILISLDRSENKDCYTFEPATATPQEKEGKSNG
jgi:integrase